MNKFLVIISFVILQSCYENDECKSAYAGIFMIDTTLMHNQVLKAIISEHRWDTIRLISSPDGKYHFSGNDTLLKNCEGNWFPKSNDIEGNCFGYIDQKNRTENTSRMPFDIWVEIRGEAYFLPFRKINSLNMNFTHVKP